MPTDSLKKPTRSREKDQAIVVLTSAPIDEILVARESTGWALNPRRAQQAQFLVCCRNEAWDNKRDGAVQGEAFLVGKIAGLRQLTDDARVNRFAIILSECARVSIKGAWKTNTRNPVGYATLRKFKINPAKLKFAAMPAAPPAALTIAQAKEALAASLGVIPDKIEIIVRG